MPAPRTKKPKEPPERKKLTPAQRLFADYVIEGKMKSDAYRFAYPASTLTGHALSVEAGRTAALPHVADYIADALAERRREVLLTRDAKRQILGSIARDPKAPRNSRILAVKTDNEMTGDNAPVRVEGELTLGMIFRALIPSVAVPTSGEAKALEAEIVGEVPALPMAGAQTEDDPLPVPAMEKAKQA